MSQLNSNAGFLSAQELPAVMNSLAAVGEQARMQAEIQSALTVAAARPRDERRAIEKIEIACSRQKFAEMAESTYARGGTPILVPSIHLLTAIAQAWGNLWFGFRELENRDGQSSVMAIAWDLESNTRREVLFTVPHAMKSGQSMKRLVDPRDIYEWVSNNAQRRVRTCLESVIPKDVVEMAREKCRETVKAKNPITPAVIEKTVTAFSEIGVTLEMLEDFLQRSINAMTSVQYVRLREAYRDIMDGVAEIGDKFDLNAGKRTPAPQPQTVDAVTPEPAQTTQPMTPTAKKLAEKRAAAQAAKAAKTQPQDSPSTDTLSPEAKAHADRVATNILYPEGQPPAEDVLAPYKQMIDLTGSKRALQGVYDKLCGPESDLSEELRDQIGEYIQAHRLNQPQPTPEPEAKPESAEWRDFSLNAI